VVRVGSAERMETLDAHLWTFSEQSFLAHGTARDGHPSRQPIYLTTEDENPERRAGAVPGGRRADRRLGLRSLTDLRALC
jgi:DNA polymerase IIIc chi subunit